MSSQQRSVNISQPEDFFSFMMEPSPARTSSIVVCSLTIIFIPTFVYSIIWTFINRLTSSTCWISIEFFLIIQGTEIVRWLYGPLPHWWCFSKTIVRSAYITELLLYFDAVAVVRYLFIFRLKNPAAFKEDFWCVFLSFWIRGASLIFNAVWFIKAEHQIINYYLCTGLDPTEDFKKPLKLYATTEIGSLLINVLIYLRIKLYKLTKPRNQSDVRNLKELFLEQINRYSMTSFYTNIFHVGGTLAALYGSAHLSKLEPSEMKGYKDIMYFQYLVSPCVLCTSFVVAYYIRHKPLRKAVANEIKDVWADWKEHMIIYKTQLASLNEAFQSKLVNFQ